MRKFHARGFAEWPRRQRGDPILQDTNEAIYYTYIVPDRMIEYNKLKKWRRNALQDLEALKKTPSLNYDRMFDLAVRAQFYRECMEEIKRLNEGGK